MALVTTPHDIYRGTSGITLPKELSNEIWANAVQESAIMRLAQRIDLPGSGITIPVITADPSVDPQLPEEDPAADPSAGAPPAS